MVSVSVLSLITISFFYNSSIPACPSLEHSITVDLRLCHICSFSSNFELHHLTIVILHFSNAAYNSMKDIAQKQCD